MEDIWFYVVKQWFYLLQMCKSLILPSRNFVSVKFLSILKAIPGLQSNILLQCHLESDMINAAYFCSMILYFFNKPFYFENKGNFFFFQTIKQKWSHTIWQNFFQSHPVGTGITGRAVDRGIKEMFSHKLIIITDEWWVNSYPCFNLCLKLSVLTHLNIYIFDEQKCKLRKITL